MATDAVARTIPDFDALVKLAVTDLLERLSDIPYFVIIATSDCEIKCCNPVEHYNRVLDSATKSGAYIYGANHEWFNTVWAADSEYPDGGDCWIYPPRRFKIPKARQAEVSATLLSAFTRLHLLGTTEYEELLRGKLSFPSSAAPGVDLSHVDALRIYFYYPLEGEIYLDDLEFSK